MSTRLIFLIKMLRPFGLSEVNATLCPLKGTIDTPEKMFLWRKNNINGVQLLYEFHSDSELELGERYNFVKCSAVRNYHVYVPTSISTLYMCRISFGVISITQGGQVAKLLSWKLCCMHLMMVSLLET